MVEEVEVVGEKRSRKYPRIVDVRETDEKFRIARCANKAIPEVHVVKKMVVEESRVRGKPLELRPLAELMRDEPYYLKDKITGSQGAIQVFVEFVNWKWRVETLPPIYAPAYWSDEKVLEYVHKLMELGKWMANPRVSTNRLYPKIVYLREVEEVDSKTTIDYCEGCEPFEVRIVKRVVVGVNRRSGNSFWRKSSWVRPLKELQYFEPYFFKHEIGKATQLIMEFDWCASKEEELSAMYVPAGWDYETNREFVCRLLKLSRWIAVA